MARSPRVCRIDRSKKGLREMQASACRRVCPPAPVRHPGVPSTPPEITNRPNEIACHDVLETELQALPKEFVLTSDGANEAPLDLPILFKSNGAEAFLSQSFTAGRATAAREGLAQAAARASCPAVTELTQL